MNDQRTTGRQLLAMESVAHVVGRRTQDHHQDHEYGSRHWANFQSCGEILK